MKVLITGGMGYIGSHICIQMIEEGFQPIIIDNLFSSKIEVLSRIKKLTGKQPDFYQGDIRNESFVDAIFRNNDIQSVFHCSGFKSITESIIKPLEYYDNNVNGSLVLLRSMRRAGVKNIIFSSSAVIYGNSNLIPITEEASTDGTNNPYGFSKYMIERCFSDLLLAESDWSITLLRYFNPAGAHPSGIIGEDPKGIPNNLMPLIIQVATGYRKFLSVFGDDYPTKDGTGVRDYIHIMDLADGHIVALKNFNKKPGLHIYNLGTGKGFSVLEIIKLFSQTCSLSVPYQICPPRLGDVAESWASTEKIKKDLGWEATRSMEEIIITAWKWQLKMKKSNY
ncbi:UDP-glucose 4-epimerase [Candidatus Photodesmus katoptron]|uniref:UDP-glucose 4-epimerase n=1 Tax=Candidatus Photodesmus katoptron Akat1 TaxID=1236703 RepID=S3DJJ9_9GAMM|nr:UDP-glucose 4-epimerase GalE [Candidatus Photodesmus katoptron]EPE37880.1 UDP-glucose 4-epimerase [Candidatus Photodesmus katoptron Akat1]KEY90401.1 UDP-glucose 4-epimerase [Candidatus Photodesmus katoptron]